MSKRILVIDAEEHIVELVRASLASQGYLVTTCFDGKTGLWMALDVRPDLIVLDTNLQDISKLKMLGYLKENTLTKDIPLMLFTNRAGTTDVYCGLETRFDCYITKPFNPLELISFVERIFKSREEQPEPPVPAAMPET